MYCILSKNCTNFIKLNHETKLNKAQQSSTKLNKAQQSSTKLNKVSKFCFFVFLALTLSNCQVEEDAINKQGNIQTVNLNEAISFLKDNPVNINSKLSKKTTLLPDFDKITQEKIINSNQSLTIIPLTNNDKNLNSRILLLKVDSEIKGVIFNMYPKKNILKSEFSGKILISDLSGKFINGFRVDNGDIVTQFIKRNKKNITNRGYGEEPEQLGEVVVYTRSHKSYTFELVYFGWDSGGDAGGGGEFMWDSGRGGGGGGSNPETATEDMIAQAIEEQIKDSLDPCPKRVLDKLKNSTNNDIKSILETLGASKVFDVNIVSDSKIIRPATSIPDITGTNNYNIKVSSNYTSATGLFRASNLLHEIIHCYFFSLVDKYTATNNPSIFNDFPTLFQKFVDNKYPGSKDSAHHDEMANTYVNAIASALQEYNKYADPNGSVPYQVYTDLAWGGLQEAPVFKEKYKVGSIEYNRIVGRYNSESVNFSINGQVVVGKPCN